MVKKQFMKELQDFAAEKHIPMEDAIQIIITTIKSVWVNRYGTDSLKVSYDAKMGDLMFEKQLLVVPDERQIVDDISEIIYKDAKSIDPQCAVGDIILEQDTPTKLFNRVMIKEFRDTFLQNILVYHRDEEYEKCLPMLNTVVLGIVKSIKNNNAIINVNGVNTLLPKREAVASEKLREQEKVYVLIKEVTKEYDAGLYQVIVSRQGTEIVQLLLEDLVPEIKNNQVGVYKIVRIPGFKSKICLRKLVDTINPVSVAIGYNGNRVRALTKELKQEIVEFFEYDPDVQTLIVNMLKKLRIQAESYHLDYENYTVKVILKDTDIYQAIGKHGYEVSMMRQFLPEPFERMILIKASESYKVQSNFSYNFGEVLNLDEEVTKQMNEAGLYYINQIITMPEPEYLELMESMDFHSDLALMIKDRAKVYADDKAQAFNDIPGASNALFMYYNLEPDASISLAENGILTLDDLSSQEDGIIKRILRPYMAEKDIVDLLMNTYN